MILILLDLFLNIWDLGYWLILRNTFLIMPPQGWSEVKMKSHLAAKMQKEIVALVIFSRTKMVVNFNMFSPCMKYKINRHIKALRLSQKSWRGQARWILISRNKNVSQVSSVVVKAIDRYFALELDREPWVNF